MGCMQSKQRSLDETSECGERQGLLNGSSSQDEEGGEYSVSPLPGDSSPGFTRDRTSNGRPGGQFPAHVQSRHTFPVDTSPQSLLGSGSYKKNGTDNSDILTEKGKELMANLKRAYEWKDRFSHPSQEFLSLMDKLYMDCQLHLTELSTQDTFESKREADAVVNEMVDLRNHWGPRLLPSSVCNAFVRERIPITVGSEQRRFRVDCAQFFEPVPFYGNQQGNPGELMKMYRFSVYDVAKNEVVLRYYLERSNVIQLYHVLCFTLDNYRGQVHPYGSEQPSYWELRQHVIKDVHSRLLSTISRGNVSPGNRAHTPSTIPTPISPPTAIELPGPLQAITAEN